jgi:hypothetical protein
MASPAASVRFSVPFIVTSPTRLKDAPRKNAAGGDIMKAKFATIPDCR